MQWGIYRSAKTKADEFGPLVKRLFLVCTLKDLGGRETNKNTSQSPLILVRISAMRKYERLSQ
ncbi:hypothetical protein ACS0TY_005394 [Phlomoides rotata]